MFSQFQINRFQTINTLCNTSNFFRLELLTLLFDVGYCLYNKTGQQIFLYGVVAPVKYDRNKLESNMMATSLLINNLTRIMDITIVLIY